MDQLQAFEDTVQELVHTQKVVTKDGVEFTVTTNDILELTEEQFNHLAVTVLRRKAEYIRKDGVDIATLTPDQIYNVLNEITVRLKDSENPLGDNLIQISKHIQDDHVYNHELLKKRGWYRDTIQEIYDDIVSVIKEAHDVRKAIIKFHPSKDTTIPKFTFTVLGVKTCGEAGEVSIAFIDSDEFILAVTII